MYCHVIWTNLLIQFKKSSIKIGIWVPMHKLEKVPQKVYCSEKSKAVVFLICKELTTGEHRAITGISIHPLQVNFLEEMR